MKKNSNNTSVLVVNLLFTASVMIFSTTLLFGQDRNVTGTVKDETGMPLPGVNIQLKNTMIGTVTDIEGNYSVNLGSGEGGILMFSFIGYAIQEIEVGQRSKVDIELAPNVTELQEVVVTGYSTIMKKDLSSSISVVDVDEMKKLASSNIGDQLQGKLAGVQISTTGDPASHLYVRIRGIGTINNNEPLYVIDGVPVQNETDLNFLNPNDIESLQVLKDASASIYGARAASGVIVINTKQGSGRSKFTVDFFTGVQDPQQFPVMANPAEMLEIQKELTEGAGGTFKSDLYVENPVGSGNWVLPDFIVNTKGYLAGDPAVDPSKYVLNTADPDMFTKNYPIAAANKEGTNWFRETFKPAAMTSVQFSASGGNEKGTHYFSLNYFDNNGILIENKWQRLQVRLNNTFSVRKNIRVGENLNVAIQSIAGGDLPLGSRTARAYSYLSIVPVEDINGYWAAGASSGTSASNPVAGQTRIADGQDYTNVRITGNAFAEIDFLKDLTFKANAGLDYFQKPVEEYNYACPECSSNGRNSLYKEITNTRNWVLTGTLNFSRTFGIHKIYALAGAEARNSYNESFYAYGADLRFGDDKYFRELSNTQSGTYQIGSQSTNSTMASLFANVNYTYREKYIIAATLRRDGSSRFINNKYGLFPGISAAVRISEEPFFRDLNFINELKLRASYGVTGNNEVVGGDYPGYSSYGTSLSFSSYAIDGIPVNKVTQGFSRVSTGNPNLKWETSHLTNVALDATLMDKFDVTLEWYYRKTNDMIMGITPPLETGFGYPVNTNVGSMENKGIDLQVNYRGKSLSKKLSYTIGLTGTHYTNKVLNLTDSVAFLPGASLHAGYPAVTRTQAGHPVSQFYGYVSQGIWQSQSEIDSDISKNNGEKPGRMKFRDVDGDSTINDLDRTYIGNPIPKFILGLNLTLNYMNFDLTAYFSGMFGHEVFNSVKSYTDFENTDVTFGGSQSKSKEMLYERGKSLPALDRSDTYSGKISSYFVEDASFIRCRNVVLGYTLPKKITLKAGLTRARLYLQTQNLFTITGYSGLDPDVTILGPRAPAVPKRDLTTGLDVGRYPVSRQYIVGVNIEF